MKPVSMNPELKDHLDRLRAGRGDRVTAEEIATIVESVMSSLSGDITMMDLKLYSELDALARFIQNAKAEIAAVRPEEISQKDIPLATDELDAVVGATEEATGVILDSAEMLEVIATKVGGEVGDEISNIVTRIYEACNFQDITGQRITKVVRTLKHIEDRVAAMLGAFGDELAKIKTDGPIEAAPVAVVAPPAPRVNPIHVAVVAPHGDAALLNGPQMPDDAKRQAEIDAILASFD